MRLSASGTQIQKSLVSDVTVEDRRCDNLFFDEAFCSVYARIRLRLMNERSNMGFAPEADEDRELVQQIRNGRPELFHELVQRHESAIFRGAMAILGNAADAEDVTQETFLRAFRRIDQFRGEAKFRTWLIQIAVNIARSRRRKTQWEHWSPLETVSETATNACAVSSRESNPEEEYSRKELGGLLKKILDGMHPSYRSVLFLREVEKLSTGTTALALGLTPESVRTRLRRARIHLRERLLQYLGRVDS
jgi:RNA polymerase sigma-70 factor (ECF subfamily)